MDVGHVMAVAQGVVTEFVRGAVDGAAFDARAGEPDGETVRVMVAAVFAAAALFEAGRAAEFRAEHHQHVVHEAALFEIAQQAGHRQVHIRAELLMIVLELLV